MTSQSNSAGSEKNSAHILASHFSAEFRLIYSQQLNFRLLCYHCLSIIASLQCFNVILRHMDPITQHLLRSRLTSVTGVSGWNTITAVLILTTSD